MENDKKNEIGRKKDKWREEKRRRQGRRLIW